MPRTKASDPADQRLLDDVARYGWHCMHIMGEGDHQPFSYTVGLFQTYAHPELIIYGLRREVAHAVFSTIADAAAQGRPIDLNLPTEDLLEGYSCVFVEVPESNYRDHVGFALWYYEGNAFPVVQVVWPSRNQLFPWHPDATDAFRRAQPVLGQHEKGV